MMERFYSWLAYRLPRGLAYWCAARVVTHASVIHTHREMNSLTPAECLKAWTK